MRKPHESLDDFIVQPESGVTMNPPPRKVWLYPTSESEILKPLVRSALHQPLWFRRFVAVGSGAFVIVALALISAILIGINEPAGPEVAVNGQVSEELTQSGEPSSSDLISSTGPATATLGFDIVRANVERRPSRINSHVVDYKSDRPLRPMLQADEPNFAPTTLVIYAENGTISSRVEPWVQ